MAGWTLDNARELYGIDRWGNGFYDLDDNGDVVVHLRENGKSAAVSLKSLVDEVRERGGALPLLLRFRNLLDRRIEALNDSFRSAMEASGYTAGYRGVYPIKVNQQQQVIEEISDFGRQYNYGLEAGSRPELLVALSYMHDPGALIICNGYKDNAFVDLALQATRMGLRVILVIEMPGELPTIIARSKALGIRPDLGVRFRLSTGSEGRWAGSGGDRSTFGLNAAQLIDAVDLLREEGYLDCLHLFHYHQGSQLPNIRAIREAANEAVRVYLSLCEEGAPMGLLDLGGGLAIDYDGTQSSAPSSCNYGMAEYAADLVEVVQAQCDRAGAPHPELITESGRAVVAYYSVLVFDILDVTEFAHPEPPDPPSADSPEMLRNLWDVGGALSGKKLQECYNDAYYYRDQVRELFNFGQVTLRDRAHAEKIFWHLLTRINAEVQLLEHVPEELETLESELTDFYYGNFSLFQSLPDHWAINQLFPVLPLHRHNEEPTHRAVVSDITCDSDGKIDRFIDREGERKHLPVHKRGPGEDYLLGIFLVGAYQETLGDLHNLLGDPNVVSVSLDDGEPVFSHEIEGDSVADVLSYVEYDPKTLEERFRRFAERAVQAGNITPAQRRDVMRAYRASLNGYTYFEG
ncbi:MAG: biosynthetic arginine decarboxylase [Akkermansiaceae bacterium]|nr:biosynthetic arginine decarboxylase [Akkermansiaceae bacterium]